MRRLRCFTSKIDIRKIIIAVVIVSCFVFSIFPRIFQDNLNAHSKDIKRLLLINTSGCRIPNLNPWSRDIELYLKYSYPDPKCSEKWYANNDSKKRHRGPALIESNATTMWIVRSALQHYKIYNISQLFCCYRQFWRVEDNINNYSFNADNNVRYSNHCEPFQENHAHLNKNIEFVKVKCSKRIYDVTDALSEVQLNDTDQEEIYVDFHAFVPLKKNVEERCSGVSPDKLSVLIIGIDSISRLNMLRQLPKTYKVFTSPPFSGISFLGYNKIGDNTFPNLVALLTGSSEKELSTKCWPSRLTKIDSCPFIWKNFSSNGYRTAYGEDSTTISTFNYKKVGFVEQPTDYYARPFLYESLKEIGHVGKTPLKLCTGPRQSFAYFLNYIQKFVNRFSTKPYFGFFWSNVISHTDLNVPHIGDVMFAEMLQESYASGAFNNSVIVLMSDHGIRWGKFRETYQGRLEERLPFFMISFPEWFKKQYSAPMENLKLNSENRLTTPYDVYETLIDLINYRDKLNSITLQAQENELTNNYDTNLLNNYNANRNNEESLSSIERKYKRGISLFLPIPSSRTCMSAGVSPHWCTCQSQSSVSTKNGTIINATNYLMKILNNKLRDYSDCEQLNVSEVKYAEMKQNPDLGQFNIFFTYLIVFITRPGEAIFEATVQHKQSSESDNFEISGPISRLNSYENQSYCVNDSVVQLYCYCKIL